MERNLRSVCHFKIVKATLPSCWLQVLCRVYIKLRMKLKQFLHGQWAKPFGSEQSEQFFFFFFGSKSIQTVILKAWAFCYPSALIVILPSSFLSHTVNNRVALTLFQSMFSTPWITTLFCPEMKFSSIFDENVRPESLTVSSLLSGVLSLSLRRAQWHQGSLCIKQTPTVLSQQLNEIGLWRRVNLFFVGLEWLLSKYLFYILEFLIVILSSLATVTAQIIFFPFL